MLFSYFINACCISMFAVFAGLFEYKKYHQKSIKELIKCLAKYVLIVLFTSAFLISGCFPGKFDTKLDINPFSLIHDKKFIYLLIWIGIVFGTTLLVSLCSIYYEKHSQAPESKLKKRSIVFLIFAYLILMFDFILIFGTKFIYSQWGGVAPEQLIVNSASPTTGTESSIYYAGFEILVIPLIWITVITAYIIFSKRELIIKIKSKKKVITNNAKSLALLILSVIVFIPSFTYAYNKLFLADAYKAFFVNSDFIEKNYVYPQDVKITFPEQKRNLIFIYLESMENSYLSRELGGYGYADTNLMPELTELSYEGITFSNNSTKFGGPIQIAGTQWSLASMVNQNLGIPMKRPVSMNSYSVDNRFLPGAYGIGDILEKEGYNQTVMIGSKGRFGGLDYLYHTHGNFKVFDADYARKNGYVPKNYNVWWGFEDDKLYKFAKEELTRLYKEGKPFNFTMETADTHMPDGYLAASSPRPYESPYANAIAYSTAQTAKFVKWIQQQPFYENTTIIMIGDHLSMDTDFFKDFDKDYLRTQYNLILNAADNVKNTDSSKFINRQYANFDMFPTVIASLGCDVEGDRLGIGTNLFSDKKTLMEEYSTEYVDEQLKCNSDFYREKLLQE